MLSFDDRSGNGDADSDGDEKEDEDGVHDEDESYLVMKVMIVKEVMKGDVSPVAMFLRPKV